MRIILSLSIFLFGIVNISQADVFLVRNKTTKEVLSLSKRNDAVFDQEKFELLILPGLPKDYPIERGIQNYKFDNGQFILNIEKIGEEEKKAKQAVELMKERSSVERATLKATCERMVAGGIKFNQLKCTDYDK